MNRPRRCEVYNDIITDSALKTSIGNYNFKYIFADDFERIIKTVHKDRLKKKKESIWSELHDKNYSKYNENETNNNKNCYLKEYRKKKKEPNVIRTQSSTIKILSKAENRKYKKTKENKNFSSKPLEKNLELQILSDYEIRKIIGKAIEETMKKIDPNISIFNKDLNFKLKSNNKKEALSPLSYEDIRLLPSSCQLDLNYDIGNEYVNGSEFLTLFDQTTNLDFAKSTSKVQKPDSSLLNFEEPYKQYFNSIVISSKLNESGDLDLKSQQKQDKSASTSVSRKKKESETLTDRSDVLSRVKSENSTFEESVNEKSIETEYNTIQKHYNEESARIIPKLSTTQENESKSVKFETSDKIALITCNNLSSKASDDVYDDGHDNGSIEFEITSANCNTSEETSLQEEIWPRHKDLGIRDDFKSLSKFQAEAEEERVFVPLQVMTTRESPEKCNVEYELESFHKNIAIERERKSVNNISYSENNDDEIQEDQIDSQESKSKINNVDNEVLPNLTSLEQKEISNAVKYQEIISCCKELNEDDHQKTLIYSSNKSDNLENSALEDETQSLLQYIKTHSNRQDNLIRCLKHSQKSSMGKIQTSNDTKNTGAHKLMLAETNPCSINNLSRNENFQTKGVKKSHRGSKNSPKEQSNQHTFISNECLEFSINKSDTTEKLSCEMNPCENSTSPPLKKKSKQAASKTSHKPFIVGNPTNEDIVPYSARTNISAKSKVMSFSLNSTRSRVETNNIAILSKITSYQEEIINVLYQMRQKIANFNPVDDPLERNRREKRITEFSVRFTRQYLYQIERLMEEIQSIPKSVFLCNKNDCQIKICTLYGIIQQATQTYFKQAKCFLIDISPKLIEIFIKYIVDVTKICKRKKVFGKNDTVVKSLINACKEFQSFLQDLEMYRTNSVENVYLKKRKTSLISEKTMFNKLSMYGSAPKKPQIRHYLKNFQIPPARPNSKTKVVLQKNSEEKINKVNLIKHKLKKKRINCVRSISQIQQQLYQQDNSEKISTVVEDLPLNESQTNISHIDAAASSAENKIQEIEESIENKLKAEILKALQMITNNETADEIFEILLSKLDGGKKEDDISNLKVTRIKKQPPSSVNFEETLENQKQHQPIYNCETNGITFSFNNNNNYNKSEELLLNQKTTDYIEPKYKDMISVSVLNAPKATTADDNDGGSRISRSREVIQQPPPTYEEHKYTIETINDNIGAGDASSLKTKELRNILKVILQAKYNKERSEIGNRNEIPVEVKALTRKISLNGDNDDDNVGIIKKTGNNESCDSDSSASLKSKGRRNEEEELRYARNIHYSFVKSALHYNIITSESLTKENKQKEQKSYSDFENNDQNSKNPHTNTKLPYSIESVKNDRLNFIKQISNSPMYNNEYFPEPWKVVGRISDEIFEDIWKDLGNETDCPEMEFINDFLSKEFTY